MKPLRIVYALLTSVLLSSCKVHITVPEGGRVVTKSGAYACESGEICTIDVVDVFFDETFQAKPAEGYTFTAWRKRQRGFCGGRSKPCRLYTTGFPGTKLMPFLESDDIFYLEPVFRPVISYEVAVFYYPWYGNPAIDGEWIHWAADREKVFSPPHDISSDYYPIQGAYSSNDQAVVSQHFKWLRDAKVGVIISSWWGQGSPDDRIVRLLLDTANQYGIKVAFHIEPYGGRTAQGLVNDVAYLYDRYGQHPAFFRTKVTSRWSTDKRLQGLFFLWAPNVPDFDSDPVGAEYWRAALDEIHNAPNGGLVIANETRSEWIDAGHFDGLYNYATLHQDPSDQFKWAQGLPGGAWYVPSVIPGFSARRIGLSEETFVPRRGGGTYDKQWEAALGAYVKPAMVTITSFNEWHEGTQIEPAAQGAGNKMGYTYEDYMPLLPQGYLTKTRQWVEKTLNWQWPILCPFNIQITTTSDWTAFGFKSGGGWLHPDIISASAEATGKGLENGYFILTQPVPRAEIGGEVQIVVDIDLSLDDPSGQLEFYIERGHIGATQIVISGSLGSEIVSFEWSGINPDPRNTLNIQVPASNFGEECESQ